jgi:lysine-ketoglutarate reductase/saccharopine dehydrogenase-like protein (TIGR00300 family)
MGIKVQLPERPREGVGVFGFMSSRASSEKPTPSLVKQLARDLYQARRVGEKIVVVAGPAVVHTGASPSLSKMISLGYVQALLSGNALAVHDVEYALYGTSLGIDIEKGVSALKGNRNHLLAINEVNKAGSLKKLVEKGILKKGTMCECIKNNVPFCLAGSIRDDGPIPDVVTDMVKAQGEYRKLLEDARILIMLATTLHSIAVGNLSSSTAKMICVDINPSVPLKLTDRGTAQAVGVVSDVGVFLPLLVNELESLQRQ